MHDDAISAEQRVALSALKPAAERGFYQSPPDPAIEVPVASLPDIAAMKVEAIASRGGRKDFYDPYFICNDGLGLAGALDAFERRFANASPDVAHRMKALAYFDDAERAPEPLLLRPAAWADVRAYFENESRMLWKNRK